MDAPLGGGANMAVDEALLMSAEAGGRPALRLYGWSEPTISIGYLQGASQFDGYGLPVVRRLTGGRAVLHDMEVTYSVTAGRDTRVFSAGILGAYSLISGCIIEALKEHGMDAEFSRARQSGTKGRGACFHTPSRFEVLLDGKKLVGSAQRRFSKAFLQHGSILFSVDEEMNARVFGPDVVDRMAWVSSSNDTGMEAFKSTFVRKISAGLNADFQEGRLDEKEEALKNVLIATKYSAPEWTGVAYRGPGSDAQPLTP